MQFPDEPTWKDRGREMTRTYRYRLGPTILVGVLCAGRDAPAWQALGIAMFVLAAAEGLLKVWVEQEKR